MAPFQQRTAAAATSFILNAYDGFITKRNAHQSSGTTESDTLAVMFVSIAFATISVIAALVAFYWFVRMRRGFRQDMIMLLIQSDMSKALWLLISPLYYFISKRPLNSSAAFCQVSGFFLAVSIEASDIAVLLIAIHTTLFVVKRQHPGTTFGLQPYRRVAYTLWASLPILLAAVVPITGNSFVDSGPYCYLPISPGWYRETLAWIPRYIVFSVIIVTYTGLYLYVYIRFRRFGEHQRRASTFNSVSTDSSTRRHLKRKWRNRSVPPTPHLTTHGLLDSTRVSLSKNDHAKLRQYSLASTVSTLHNGDGIYLPIAPDRALRKSSIAWNLVDFGRDGNGTPASITPCSDTVSDSPTTQISKLHSNDIDIDNNTNNNITHIAPAAISTPEPAHATGSNDRDPPPSSRNQRDIRHNRWKRRFRQHDSDPGPRNSLASIMATLRQGPPRRPATTTGGRNLNGSSSAGVTAGEEEDEELEELEAATNSSESVHLASEETEESMRRSRDRMKRQMRLLFVYPAIYLVTWIAPFLTHAYRYDDKYSPTARNTTSPGADNSTATNLSNIIDSMNLLLAPPPPSSSSPSPFSYTSYPSSPASLTFPPEPLALRIISMASLCISAAVDCAFFSAWERPWRHLRGGFWENMASRLRIHRVFFSRGGSSSFSGRTRDERVADERAARIRRERERREIADATARGDAGGGGPSRSTTRVKSEDRNFIVGRGGSDGGGGAGGENLESGGGGRERKRREWWDALDEATL